MAELSCVADRGVDVEYRLVTDEHVSAEGAGQSESCRRGRGSLVKTKLIRRRGPWRGLNRVELATLEWVDWFNNRRLHSACGDAPPAEYEREHYRQIPDLKTLEAAESSLH